MIATHCQRRFVSVALSAVAAFLVLACVVRGPLGIQQHRWWAGLGAVLPHDTFPSDCTLCHVGEDWQTLREDFAFDHVAETGVPLEGAHAEASCLRCHNDRGPVSVFAAQGCAGCHEDVHFARQGPNCESCHEQGTWQPFGQIERHYATRFPLTGVHASTSCRRCHTGAEVGIFSPVDTACASCHGDDLARATNPNHVGLGWVNRCDRCHMPTDWHQTEL